MAKNSSWPVTGLGNKGPLKVLNGTKLIIDDHGNNLDSFRISLKSFRFFRGPLLLKPVTGQELFFAISYSSNGPFHWYMNSDDSIDTFSKDPLHYFNDFWYCISASNHLNDLKKLTWFPYCLPASLDFMRVACKVDTRGRKIVLRSKDLEENWKKRNRYQLVSEQMENKKKVKLKQVRLKKYWVTTCMCLFAFNITNLSLKTN